MLFFLTKSPNLIKFNVTIVRGVYLDNTSRAMCGCTIATQNPIFNGIFFKIYDYLRLCSHS